MSVAEIESRLDSTVNETWNQPRSSNQIQTLINRLHARHDLSLNWEADDDELCDNL